MEKNIVKILDETVGNQLSKSAFDLDPNADLFDYGLDSIGFINIIIALENEFNIFIDQDDLDLAQFSTINNIQQYISDKTSS